jgi:hypothetical protein
MKLRWKILLTYKGDWLIGEKNEYKKVLQYQNTEGEEWTEVEVVGVDSF